MHTDPEQYSVSAQSLVERQLELEVETHLLFSQ
jgi:hypothetical protein